jgi:hypothetical protein
VGAPSLTCRVWLGGGTAEAGTRRPVRRAQDVRCWGQVGKPVALVFAKDRVQNHGTVGSAEAGVTGFTATAGSEKQGERGVNLRRTNSAPAQVALVAMLVAATMLLLLGAVAGIGSAGGSASAAQYQYGKVTICHVAGQSGERVTITVAASAVPAHLDHGDRLGACP